MKNQQGLKLFFILSCCTAFLVAFAQVGAFAFSSISEDSFSNGVQLSTVDLSGKTAAEAAPHVKDAIENWEEAQTIKIIYKENEHMLGSDIYQFLVEESLEAAVPGNVILKVEVNREKLLESIDEVAPGQSGDVFNIEQISNEIISHASVLSGDSVAIDLQNYEIVSTEEKTSLAVSQVKLPTETTGIAEHLEALGVISIPPVSQFSLNQFMEEKGQLQADPVFLNMIASGIYEVLLQTNFKVIERHISADVPGKERIGYDVKISQGSNMDLVVFNPNEQEYNLELSIENGSLAVKLIGVPFTGNIDVSVTTEEFKPKIIKRYNSLLKPDENKVEQEGKSGLLVTVTRKSFDGKGKLINTELVSEDFYPPVHKIEISGLKPEPANEAPDLSNPKTIVLPGQGASEGGNESEQQSGVTTPPVSEDGDVKTPVNTGPEKDGNNADKDNQRGTVKEDGGIWGKPDEDEK